MRLQTVSIFVDDQQRALDFYTGPLALEVALDIPLGEHRWLTVQSPGQPGGAQLSLEPAEHPAVGPFRDALAADGIPFLVLGVDDVAAEHERLSALGVRFTQPPVTQGPVTTAVFEDGVGNLLQIAAYSAG